MSRSFRLRGDDNFIVMATDGLWEVINPKACIAIINQLINQYSLEVGNHEFHLEMDTECSEFAMHAIPEEEDLFRQNQTFLP